MKKIIQVIIIIYILCLCTYTYKTFLRINKVEINKHFPIYPHGDL